MLTCSRQVVVVMMVVTIDTTTLGRASLRPALCYLLLGTFYSEFLNALERNGIAFL